MYIMVQSIYNKKKKNYEEKYIESVKKEENLDDSGELSIDISILERNERDLLKPEDVRKIIL